MANLPDERLYVRNAEGDKVKLAGLWAQAKGQLTGKIVVTAELAELFKPGAELQLVSFPNSVFPPKAKTPTP